MLPNYCPPTAEEGREEAAAARERLIFVTDRVATYLFISSCFVILSGITYLLLC